MFTKEIPKDKLMYSDNVKLWRKGINYYHLDTMEPYSILLERGWLKEDLFSHLIAQRIKLYMKTLQDE